MYGSSCMSVHLSTWTTWAINRKTYTDISRFNPISAGLVRVRLAPSVYSKLANLLETWLWTRVTKEPNLISRGQKSSLILGMRNVKIVFFAHILLMTLTPKYLVKWMCCWWITAYLLVLDVDELSSRSFHARISDQNLSSLFLNEFVDCASITCCGNEFQLLQTRTLKNVFRTVLAHRGT